MTTLLASLSPSTGAPPTWTVLPFAAYLLVIAVVPLFLGHFWEKNRNKFILAVVFSIPVILFLLFGQQDIVTKKDNTKIAGHAVSQPDGGMDVKTSDGATVKIAKGDIKSLDSGHGWLHHSIREYLGFLALLASLFIISGGVYFRGSLAGTPIVNTGVLAIGALLASFIGTTGASMLLIRPLLRANEKRQRKVHLVIFFIFIVSNGAGMLTPLGDPPLFLGFLRGVPFFWTMQLLAPWALVNGILLVLFNIMDQAVLNKEEKERAGSQLEEVQQVKERLKIEGGINFLWLLGVIGVIYVLGRYGDAIKEKMGIGDDLLALLQIIGMLAMAGLSLKSTSKEVRTSNKFGWGPIIEVAVIFIGIFVTMVPALKYLEAQGTELGVTKPWQFFWASGALSSFLDNAPTYLTFASLAVGVVNQTPPGANLDADKLGELAAHVLGAKYLIAVSCGAVFMGANTYIGNGPNFMVKAIAEENGVKMPSFFGYMLWSIGILIPLFIIVTLLFFRG